MSEFFEDEAEVSDRSSSEDEGSSVSEDGEFAKESKKKNKSKNVKKRKRMISDDDDDEEEEDIDEDAIAEEMKDFINEEVEEEGEEEEGEDEAGEKRKHESEEELTDDDYALIEENLGIKVKRAKKLKRIRRVMSDDEDSEKEEDREGDDREALAQQLFEGGEEEEDEDDVVSHRKAAEKEFEDLNVEGSEDEDDIDDFIVDDDGQPIKRQKNKKHIIHTDSLLQEAQDIFGVDFDFEEFKDYGEEESEEEFEDEYMEEDADMEDAEGRPKPKKKGRRTTKKGISDVFEPIELEQAYFTDVDNEIRATDMPERFQLRQIPVKEADDQEMEEEAEWIHKQAFMIPSVSTQNFLEQEGHGGQYGYYKKGPSMVSKIKKAIDFMRNKNLEVPFIAFYRKEYVEPDLNINDLWKVWQWDEKWTQLRSRKLNLIKLFERMQNYQYEQNSDPDKVLEINVRTLTEEDIDRVRKVESLEELRDVYNHFLLYYGSDIVKMRNMEKAKKNEEAKTGEDGEEPPEQQETIKQASRKSGYTLCVKNKIDEIAMRFGLAPEQFGENIRDNYQRHEVDQCPMEPIELAKEYVSGQFATPEEVLLGARYMVAMQLSHEPLVRHVVRQAYFERAKLRGHPTKKGIKTIDEAHPCYPMRFLNNKPVKDLRDEQFLRLSQAEEEGLMKLTMYIDEETDNPSIQTYFEEIRQLYYRDEFSHLVQQWNIQRSQALEQALSKILYPQMEKELRLKLLAEAKEGITKACCRKLYNWLKVAPYQADQQLEEDYDDYDNNEQGLRVLGIAYVANKDQTAFGALVNGEGQVSDFIRLQNLTKRSRSFRQMDREDKEKDMQKLKDFIENKKPHVVAVTAENYDALMIIDDIKKVIAELQQEVQMPPINVELVDNELALVYENSKKAESEFREYPPVLKHAVSIARRIQEPLVEFAQLCNQDEDILCLKYHPLQDAIPKEDLLNALYLEFVNRVNEVGVDINMAITNPHTAALVQFVCGLGPRKGTQLIKTLKHNNSRLENRTQLVTLCRMGPKVFINCGGFIKIDTNSIVDSTEAYVEVLDGSRVHPETYEWARKMAVDALEYDDTAEDANPAGALEEILESPERLKDLDLDAFAEELERQGYGDKHITLYDIRAELNHRYKDLRTPYRSPTNEERFNMITKETPDTFYMGKLLLVEVAGVAHRKPRGEELDQADPVRNEETGLWQCPFCNKSDFPELSEVWSHFDAGSCPGSAVGVRCRLDNGCMGFIHIKSLSDKKVTDPLERVKIGMSIHARITKIDIDHFKVDLTSKSSDLLDKDDQWKPQKDLYYDQAAEKKEFNKEEEQKKQKARQTYIKRVIAHPSFHNVDYKECEKILANMDQGDCIIRPSSKGSDHLTVTWKVVDGVLQHIDVKEEGKENAFSLGHTLLINGEEFEDLDEIIARHIQPMAGFARDIINFKNYKTVEGGKRELIDRILIEEKRKAPSRIPYVLSAARQYPGKFMLSYMPRTKPTHEYVSVNPHGMKYRNKNFHSLNSLMKWFKEHFRDPVAGTPSGRTPMVSSNVNTPSFNLQGVDAATIQRAAAGLPSNIYNTLAQVAGVTPGVTPGITPRVTPGFTPGYTPRAGFTPHTPAVGGSGGGNFAGSYSGGVNYRPVGGSMVTPSYRGSQQNPSSRTPAHQTPSYQPTPRSDWPGATPRTPQAGQSSSGSRPGASSAGTDWAKAAEMWAKQQKRPKAGTPRGGQSPAVRPSPRSVDQSPAGGDATPLFDER